MLNQQTADGEKVLFLLGNRQYQVIVDHKNGWKQEAFRERYSEVLDRYDYIVGDWGYNQLRLRGFFRDGHPKVTKDMQFSTIQDYLNEYCNFGCAFFILERMPGKHTPAEEPAHLEDKEESGIEVSAPSSYPGPSESEAVVPARTPKPRPHNNAQGAVREEGQSRGHSKPQHERTSRFHQRKHNPRGGERRNDANSQGKGTDQQ